MSASIHRLSGYSLVWALAVVICAVFNASPAFAQYPSITGTVTNATTSAPVAGVSVAFYSSSGSLVASTSTNAQGAYMSPGLPAGSYFIWAIPPAATGLAGQLHSNISCANYCSVTSGTPVVVTANSAPTINFLLPAGGAITGAVIDAAAAPLAGVTINFRTSTGSYTASTTTNALGVYTSPLLAPGSYFVVATASGLVGELFNNIYCPGGYCSLASGTPVLVTAPNTTSNINFVLGQGGTIAGTVINATTGAPVAGVTVNVYSSSGSLVGSTTTNAQGGYTSHGVLTGSYFIRAVPSTASGLVAELHNNIICIGDCSPFGGTPVAVTLPNTTTINFALAPGATITGQVTQALTPNVLAGVSVSFYSSNGSLVTSTSTNAQGMYSSPTLPSGSYFVRAIPSSASNLLGQLYNNIPCHGSNCLVTSGTPVVVTAPNATPNINFALSLGATITGTVTNATTFAPVASATVSVYSSSGSFVKSTGTNAQGAYTLAGLATGSYFVRAIPLTSSGLVGLLYNGIACPYSNCLITSGTPIALTAPNAMPNINFALPVGAAITGTVTNATTAAPVASVTVQVYSSSGSFLTSVSTNAQGIYTAPGLATGSYVVRALPSSASGLVGQLYNGIPCPNGSCVVTSGTPIAVAAPNTVSNINFALVVGGTITGTVTNATTLAPIAGVYVEFYSSSGSYVSWAFTNTQGVYTSMGLVTGSYFAVAYPPTGFVRQLYNNINCPSSCPVTSGTPVVVTAPSVTSNINFALAQGGTITGVVTNSTTSAPVPSVTVSFYSSSGLFVASSFTNSQGAYTSVLLPAGSYFVRALPPTSSPLLGQLYNNIACPGGNCSVTSGTPVLVTAAGVTTANFGLIPGATIRGTVTNAATAAPVGSVAVRFYSSNGSLVASVTTDSLGAYTSPGLVTGSYFVVAIPSASSALVGQMYQNLPCPGGSCIVTSGTAVAVTVPNTTSNINFALALAPNAPNDTLATAIIISSLPYQSIVYVGSATTSAEDPAVTCGNGSTQKSVWYFFTPAADGPVLVTTFGSSYDTILSIYTGSPGDFSPVGCNDDSGGLQSSFTAQGVAGQRLSILVSSQTGASGVLVLNVTNPGPLPAVFGKSTPANMAGGQPLSPTLTWGASAGAMRYEYCYDATNDYACAGWVSAGTATNVGLIGLAPSTQYFWQIRAVNGAGTTYADVNATAFWTFSTGVAAPAFGQVDTPVQNAAGVQGAIGITGWALDESGVTSVQIFRNCLAFEPAACQTVLGHSVVYIGDAAFIAGARPDVAAAYPTHPDNTRAGWGYLILTPLLPHVSNNQPYGGQGPLTLYAVATDTIGDRTLLGRSSDPASPSYDTPTAITMANDTIAKPFGAIDTPAQGETISGTFNNFGWALTPDSNTVAGDPGDIEIPTNGSTMTVFIDGLPIALVSFNQCRGNVGNPVPAGLYCNDDVASIFGNVTPMDPLTTRTSNPTLFRNLDAGRGAIGAYTFNTMTLSDGLHTIAWSVTDSQGRTEGIGSRFFVVSNGGNSPLSEAALRAAPAQHLGPVSVLSNATPEGEGVWGRMGFDLAEAWKAMTPREDGTFLVRLEELGRLELWLGGSVDAGYLVTDDGLQPLPVGSSLAGPVFAWMPPAGYVGSYRLAFMRGTRRIDVTVMVVTKATR